MMQLLNSLDKHIGKLCKRGHSVIIIGSKDRDKSLRNEKGQCLTCASRSGHSDTYRRLDDTKTARDKLEDIAMLKSLGLTEDDMV